MTFYLFFVASLIAAIVHLYFDRQPRTGGRIAEVFLLWFLLIDIGLQGVFAFIGHTALADQVADSIGFPTGNPFQTEVAVANLAFGTLGILCYWLRSNFWTATVIGASVWLLGNAAGHIEQIIVAHNYHPNNAGAALYSDIVVPLLLIALLVYHKYAGVGEREPARVR